jgi:hypothetical protein
MSRCGCSGTSCSCIVEGSGAITVTGSGSGASPYVVSGGGVLNVSDTASVDLTLTGDGSSGSPYSLSADATIDVEDLANLDITGLTTGDGILYNGTGWEVGALPTATPGVIDTDATLVGDGSVGDPLGIFEDPTDTYTPVWTALTTNPSIGSGSITGRFHVDPTSRWVDVSIEIVCASDTGKGSGEWEVSLPFQSFSGRGQTLTLLMTYPTIGTRVGAALINGGMTKIERMSVTSGTSATGTEYITGSLASTWTSGGRVIISGRYEREP